VINRTNTTAPAPANTQIQREVIALGAVIRTTADPEAL
jgi:hypothetical protein